MNKFFAALAFLFPFLLAAQPVSLVKAIAPQPFLPVSDVQPVHNSAINYTQVMFEHPAMPKVVAYRLRIFSVVEKDTQNVFTILDSTTATLVNGLEFGKSYAWNYEGISAKGKSPGRSKWYAFKILPAPDKTRIRVIKNDSAQNQQGLVTFDYSQIITDRNGKIVWFLPPSPGGEFMRDNEVRDLRVSPAGTFTFLTEKGIYEVTVDGRILWRTPPKPVIASDNLEHYHHSLERLPNGHLLTMGMHTVKRQAPGDTAKVDVIYDVIGEYDRKGQLVWKWDSKNYLHDTDIFWRKLPDGKPDVSIHGNAVTPIDSGRYLLVGFRDLNRIVKMERSTGKVVASYGDRMCSGEAQTGNNFFWHQHSACLLRDGSIAVFNNDSVADPKISSSVVIFSQPKPGEPSTVLWTFPCNFDSLTNGKSTRAGGIEQLPNGNYLVNMGALNRCIEVMPGKEVVWDAFEESWSADKKEWTPFNQYRSHFVSSLYPCYFTAQLSGKIGATVTVNIFNEGTEADSYVVEYKLADGSWFTERTTAVTAVSGKAVVTMKRPGANGFEYTEVRVRSVANPDFIRTLQLN